MSQAVHGDMLVVCVWVVPNQWSIWELIEQERRPLKLRSTFIRKSQGQHPTCRHTSINCYNLGVHVASWLCYGFATTFPEGAWTF
jgi:hypothetical protein